MSSKSWQVPGTRRIRTGVDSNSGSDLYIVCIREPADEPSNMLFREPSRMGQLANSRSVGACCLTSSDFTEQFVMLNGICVAVIVGSAAF